MKISNKTIKGLQDFKDRNYFCLILSHICIYFIGAVFFTGGLLNLINLKCRGYNVGTILKGLESTDLDTKDFMLTIIEKEAKTIYFMYSESEDK